MGEFPAVAQSGPVPIDGGADPPTGRMRILLLAESRCDSVTFMRIRRLGRNFSFIVLPAICCAVSLYFGYNFFFGGRGLLAWRQTQDQLSVAKHDLAAVRSK